MRDYLGDGVEYIWRHGKRHGHWYFSAQDNMKLGPFNTLLFFVFLPLLILQIYAVYTFMGTLTDLGGMISMLKNMVAGNAPEDAGWWPKLWITWGAPLLPYVLYMAMLPAAVMRLRDMGWQTKWAGVLGVGSILGMLKAVFDIAVPFWLRFLLGCVEVFVMTMLTMKGSAKVHANDGKVKPPTSE